MFISDILYCISAMTAVISPFSFPILLIWVFSLFFLMSLANGLSILFTFSKNQLLILLIYHFLHFFIIYFGSNLYDFFPSANWVFYFTSSSPPPLCAIKETGSQTPVRWFTGDTSLPSSWSASFLWSSSLPQHLVSNTACHAVSRVSLDSATDPRMEMTFTGSQYFFYVSPSVFSEASLLSWSWNKLNFI